MKKPVLSALCLFLLSLPTFAQDKTISSASEFQLVNFGSEYGHSGQSIPGRSQAFKQNTPYDNKSQEQQENKNKTWTFKLKKLK